MKFAPVAVILNTLATVFVERSIYSDSSSEDEIKTAPTVFAVWLNNHAAPDGTTRASPALKGIAPMSVAPGEASAIRLEAPELATAGTAENK